MNAYEAVIILDPTTDDAGIEREIEKVTGFIKGQGGEIVNIARWGRRKMTYVINNRQEGIYVCLQFNSQSATPKELDRLIRLDEKIVRHLVIKGHIPEVIPANVAALAASAAAADKTALVLAEAAPEKKPEAAATL